MVRNSIEDYTTVHWPLITVIECAIIASHGTKERRIICFTTLGSVYFSPTPQIRVRPLFDNYSRIPMPRQTT